MGFDENSSDSDPELDPEQNLRRRLIDDNESNKTKEDKLLDGLPLWLDRLFEGSAQRYYIRTWPELPVYNSNLNARQHMHSD